MSGAELILFLFIFALISFGSILRKRLSGAHRDSVATQEHKLAEGSHGPADAVTGISPAPGHISPVDVRSMLARKLAELVDGHNPIAEAPTAPTKPPAPYEPPVMEVHRPPAPSKAVAGSPLSADFEEFANAAQALRSPHGIGAEGVRHALRRKESIRLAIIMRELLDKPVALRGRPGARRSVR